MPFRYEYLMAETIFSQVILPLCCLEFDEILHINKFFLIMYFLSFTYILCGCKLAYFDGQRVSETKTT